MDTQMCFTAVLLCIAKLAAGRGPHASFPVSSSTIVPSGFIGRPDPETDGSDQVHLFPPFSQDNLPNPLQSYSELAHQAILSVAALCNKARSLS